MAISMDLKVSSFGAAYNRNQKNLQNDVNAAQSFFGVMQSTASDYSVARADKDKLLETFNKLSEVSKDVLRKMKNQDYISKEDWGALGKDLLAVGAISQQDYDLTRVSPQLIPMPQGMAIQDENGDWHSNPNYSSGHSILAERLKGYLKGEDITGWTGNVQEYLDQWRAMLRQMGMQKDDNGDWLYSHNTINTYVSATKSVGKVLNDLLAVI